jgi:hypothetical protein
MTEPTTPPDTQAETLPDTPLESEPASEARRPIKLLKGCGCVSGLGALALGILVIGNFDAGAWASALTAIVIGVLVFALSGTNGIWER